MRVEMRADILSLRQAVSSRARGSRHRIFLNFVTDCQYSPRDYALLIMMRCFWQQQALWHLFLLLERAGSSVLDCAEGATPQALLRGGLSSARRLLVLRQV